MKKANVIILVFLFLITSISIYSQQKKTIPAINYGNNAKNGKYIATRGIKIYYETYGKGEPLLMIHGNGGSISNFKYQIAFFQKHYKVILADSRAQGKSIDTSKTLNYEMMADDMNALLDSLHIKSTYVIGWSDGGINGLLLTIRHPDKVKKLAITGANLIPDSSVFNPEGVALIANWSSNLKVEKQDLASKNAKKLIDMMNVEPNIPLTALQKIVCPVFVIGGDNDMIKPSHTLQIFENIPKAYLWIIPASGHATLQRHKDEFNIKVREFFLKPFEKVKCNDWDD